MACATARRLLILRRSIFPPLLSRRDLSVYAVADSQLDSNHNSSSSTADDSKDSSDGDAAIFVKTRDKTSVTMPTSFITYEQVTVFFVRRCLVICRQFGAMSVKFLVTAFILQQEEIYHWFRLK
jgi:hypothetical protein